MPRRLGENIKNELKSLDPVSGSIIIYTYRIPSTEERVAYSRAMIELKDGEIILRPVEARQEFGLKIIEGFDEGAFEKKIGDKWMSFSSDPASPNYDPDWKQLLLKYAPDQVEAIASHVFDGSKMIAVQREVYDEKN